MAAMALEPRDLEFKTYEFLTISEPTTIEIQLQTLIAKHAELEKAKREQVTKVMDMRDALDELEEEMEDTRRRSRKAELKQQIEVVTEEYDAETQKVKEIQLKINKAKKMIEREKALITLSTGMTDNLEMFQGETTTSTLTAKVTLEPSNDVENYVFLLRKDTLKLEGREQKGRLIIIKLYSEEEYQESLKVKEEEPTEEVTEKEPETEEKTEEE